MHYKTMLLRDSQRERTEGLHDWKLITQSRCVWKLRVVGIDFPRDHIWRRREWIRLSHTHIYENARVWSMEMRQATRTLF